MVLLEFSMSPHGQGESLSAHVARILDVIDKSGVPYQLTPMGTILEGEWEHVMGVVTACFKALATDCARIGVNLKVDYRAGPDSRMRSKIDKVEAHLGRELRK
ncbi:MAG: MTH1187 family thiamine-binding protein [Ramlibacter sp.]